MKNELAKIIKFNDYQISDADLLARTTDFYVKANERTYNFCLSKSEIFTQGAKKRYIRRFEENTLEDILCIYLKRCIDKEYRISFPNRNRIMRNLFNCVHLLKNLNDYVIVRFDFKDYFNSVSSEYINEKYIKNSNIRRQEKDMFDDFVKSCPRCYAGLNTSNSLVEIISSDFDKKIQSLLNEFGIIFYSRYIDDGIIILKSYISESLLKDVFAKAINDVFEVTKKKNRKVKVNMSKFKYISRRDFTPTACMEEFDFLGYLFRLDYSSNNKLQLKFGITDKKLKKYYGKLKMLFEVYKADRNVERLRQSLMLATRRIVYPRSIKLDTTQWVSKGIIANYNELRFYMEMLDNNTEDFLKNIFYKIMTELSISPPYFLKNESKNAYCLYSNLHKNRAIIFEERIGVKKEYLLKNLKKVEPTSTIDANKQYYLLSREYLIKTKMGH